MPYGSAQVVFQLLDQDSGDEASTLGDWWAIMTYLQERLIRFEFTDSEKKKDEMVLTFRNSDFALLDEPVFCPGQKFAVTWGWPGQMAPPRRMVVVGVKAGDPFIVTGHCTLHLLDKEKVCRVRENVTASEYVREVAGEYGYVDELCHIDDTEERRNITQAYWTDARFLMDLARRNGREFYIDGSGLHWQRRQTQQDPVRTLHYRTDPERGSIIDPPQFEVDLSRPTGKIKVRARHPVRKEIVEAVAGPAENELMAALGGEDAVGDPDASPGLRGGRLARIDVRPAPPMTQEQAQREAWSRYYAHVKGRFKMSLPRVIGDARVGAKNVIAVFGISDIADGLYYLSEVKSTVENGTFSQSYQCEKEAPRKLKTAKTTTHPKKAGKANAPPEKGSPELLRRLTTTTDASGATVAAWTFVDNDGQAVGAVAQLRPDETGMLSDEAIETLNDMGVVTGLPDAGQ